MIRITSLLLAAALLFPAFADAGVRSKKKSKSSSSSKKKSSSSKKKTGASKKKSSSSKRSTSSKRKGATSKKSGSAKKKTRSSKKGSSKKETPAKTARGKRLGNTKKSSSSKTAAKKGAGPAASTPGKWTWGFQQGRLISQLNKGGSPTVSKTWQKLSKGVQGGICYAISVDYARRKLKGMPVSAAVFSDEDRFAQLAKQHDAYLKTRKPKRKGLAGKKKVPSGPHDFWVSEGKKMGLRVEPYTRIKMSSGRSLNTASTARRISGLGNGMYLFGMTWNRKLTGTKKSKLTRKSKTVTANLKSRHMMALHVKNDQITFFDPNLGEYVGPRGTGAGTTASEMARKIAWYEGQFGKSVNWQVLRVSK